MATGSVSGAVFMPVVGIVRKPGPFVIWYVQSAEGGALAAADIYPNTGGDWNGTPAMFIPVTPT